MFVASRLFPFLRGCLYQFQNVSRLHLRNTLPTISRAGFRFLANSHDKKSPARGDDQGAPGAGRSKAQFTFADWFAGTVVPCLLKPSAILSNLRAGSKQFSEKLFTVFTAIRRARRARLTREQSPRLRLV